MTIRYRDDGKTVIYNCQFAFRQYSEPVCQSIQGKWVDAEVTELFLAAMNPAELRVSLAALEQVEARTRQIEQQWQLRIERASYEADLARRRYAAVDPDNRLVARSLERDWNEKLVAQDQLERAYANRPQPASLFASAEERARILGLAQDFRTIWESATTTNVERKQLLRYLIEGVTLTQGEDTIQMVVHWQTGALSELKDSSSEQDPRQPANLKGSDPTHPGTGGYTS